MPESVSQPGVRSIEANDLDRVADVLGRAFDDDPVMNFLAKPDARRSQRIRKMLDIGLRKITFPYGETYVADGFAGAALWNPPDGRPTGLLNDLKLFGSLIGVVGLTRMPRVLGALNQLEQKHPKEAHYYLLAVGVEPDLQGRGIGTRLLAPTLERCDRDGIPAYLENSKERNLGLYERNGFTVVERFELPRGGPPVWRMWRDPQQPGVQ